MKSCGRNSRKAVVGLVLSALILAALALGLGVGLGGCKDLTFNGDMLGYLEYWTGTVTVGGFTWESQPATQKNSSGVNTIATNAKVSIKATIENPDNYPLDYGVGTEADTLRSVRTAGPVGGTVRVTGSSPHQHRAGAGPLLLRADPRKPRPGAPGLYPDRSPHPHR